MRSIVFTMKDHVVHLFSFLSFAKTQCNAKAIIGVRFFAGLAAEKYHTKYNKIRKSLFSSLNETNRLIEPIWLCPNVVQLSEFS